jgi:hypothetical protein
VRHTLPSVIRLRLIISKNHNHPNTCVVKLSNLGYVMRLHRSGSNAIFNGISTDGSVGGPVGCGNKEHPYEPPPRQIDHALRARLTAAAKVAKLPLWLVDAKRSIAHDDGSNHTDDCKRGDELATLLLTRTRSCCSHHLQPKQPNPVAARG